MADDKKNIPDAGKVDEPPRPGKVESVKADSSVQDQPSPAKAEAPVVEDVPKVVTPPAAEQPALADKEVSKDKGAPAPSKEGVPQPDKDEKQTTIPGMGDPAPVGKVVDFTAARDGATKGKPTEIPTVHVGVSATQMEKKGIVTERGELNRSIKAANRILREIRRLVRGLKDWIAELKERKAALLEALAEARAQASEPTIPQLLARYMEQRGEERADWTSKGKLKGAVSDFNKVQAAMEFLRQKEISTVETLDRQLDGISENAVAIRDSMRKAERRIKDIDTLLSHIGNYEKYKPVYKEYAAIGWKKQKEKFEEAHRGELDAYRAAARYVKTHLPGTSYSRKELEAERKDLAAALSGKREELEAVQADVRTLRDVRHWLNQVLPPEQYRQTAEPGKKPSIVEGLKGREQRIRQEQEKWQQPPRTQKQQDMEL